MKDPQQELSKAPDHKQAEQRGQELACRDSDSAAPLKVLSSNQALTGLSGQVCPVATGATAAVWQKQRTVPCSGQAPVLGTTLI